MKLQVKQLDEATANTISVALEMYAASITHIEKDCSTKYLELAVMFRHSIPLLVSEAYELKDTTTAQETPLKIYVHKSQHWGLMANEHKVTKGDVEYIRAYSFAPEDDVQVLCKQEKGGEQWS